VVVEDDKELAVLVLKDELDVVVVAVEAAPNGPMVLPETALGSTETFSSST